jgi:hypothetical protein
MTQTYPDEPLLKARICDLVVIVEAGNIGIPSVSTRGEEKDKLEQT